MITKGKLLKAIAKNIEYYFWLLDYLQREDHMSKDEARVEAVFFQGAIANGGIIPEIKKADLRYVLCYMEKYENLVPLGALYGTDKSGGLDAYGFKDLTLGQWQTQLFSGSMRRTEC